MKQQIRREGLYGRNDVQMEYYLPIFGVSVESNFEIESLRENDGERPSLFLRTSKAKEKTRASFVNIFSHDACEGVSVKVRMKSCHCELAIYGSAISFDATIVHMLLFLCSMRARQPVYSPLLSTRSLLTGEYDRSSGSVCMPFRPPFVAQVPKVVQLDNADIDWINANMQSCLGLSRDRRFQSCMQVINQVISLEGRNVAFLTICTGIEAFSGVSGFRKAKKISQKLAKFLRNQTIAKRVLEIYAARNQVAHGEHVGNDVTDSLVDEAFDLLCACLCGAVESGKLPDLS